jgi:hypothetical protein
VFGFEVRQWEGEISCEDPEGLVVDAEFLSLERAIDAVGDIPWLEDPRPITAYLRGEVPPGLL